MNLGQVTRRTSSRPPARAARPAPQPGDALIVVDVQRDFLSGGALSVPGAETVIDALNRYTAEFGRLHLPVVVLRDWHPVNHCSFRQFGGPWPAHCVAGTAGAELPASLHLPVHTHVLSKGAQPEAEGHSGFEGTQLVELLREEGCRRVFIGGLATDYCVRATALDALREGFEVVVLEDAIRPVDIRPGDGARALASLAAHGARVLALPASPAERSSLRSSAASPAAAV